LLGESLSVESPFKVFSKRGGGRWRKRNKKKKTSDCARREPFKKREGTGRLALLGGGGKERKESSERGGEKTRGKGGGGFLLYRHSKKGRQFLKKEKERNTTGGGGGGRDPLQSMARIGNYGKEAWRSAFFKGRKKEEGKKYLKEKKEPFDIPLKLRAEEEISHLSVEGKKKKKKEGKKREGEEGIDDFIDHQIQKKAALLGRERGKKGQRRRRILPSLLRLGS